MPAPANDTVPAASTISGLGPLSVPGDNTGATADATETGTYGAGIKTVWHRWVNDSALTQDFFITGPSGNFTAEVFVGPAAFAPTDLADALANGFAHSITMAPADPEADIAVNSGDAVLVMVYDDTGAEDAYTFPFSASGGGGTGSLSGRVSIGFDANMLDATPVWTLIDPIRDGLVARVEIRDGRQSEQDDSETGTATVYLNDRDGLFDPNNASSPYFGKLDGKPIAIAVWNPVDEEWVPQWRGTIDDWKTVLNRSTREGVSVLANVQIEAVDIFDYLAGAEMEIGVSGHVTPVGSEGIVFYEDAEVATGTDDPSDGGRIELLLDNAGVPAELWTVFSGNVNVLEGKYDAGDSYLIALREACDAEFPGIANMYVDGHRNGEFVFHGRHARLDPDAVAVSAGDAWNFQRWKAGDGAGITADPDCAQIREFAYSRPRSMLINSAISYPESEANGGQLDETKIPAQLARDPASITKYGVHGRADTELQVAGHKTNGDDGWQQCAKYALFWVTYYAEPLSRIERIVFKTIPPTDDRAAATWALITGVSISDIVQVNVGYPSGTGIQATDYYVEGREMTITPLNADSRDPHYDLVTLALNLSPAIADTEGIFD